MANLHLGGLDIDTEDIDTLVLYCPLGELDGAVRADRWILAHMDQNDISRPYFEHRLQTHEIALDIAERTFRDGVAACQQVDPPVYSITKAIKKQYKKKEPKAENNNRVDVTDRVAQGLH